MIDATVWPPLNRYLERLHDVPVHLLISLSKAGSLGAAVSFDDARLPSAGFPPFSPPPELPPELWYFLQPPDTHFAITCGCSQCYHLGGSCRGEEG